MRICDQHLTNSDMSKGFNQQTLVLPNCSQHLAGPILGLDVGGSLAKVAYTTRSKEAGAGANGVCVNLVTFDSEHLDDCLDFLRNNVVSGNHCSGAKPEVVATGVGCCKFKEKIAHSLNVKLEADCEEMSHAVRGLEVLWQNLDSADLLYNDDVTTGTSGLRFRTSLANSATCPLLLVNIGSAMTIVKIDANGCMRNIVGGSTMAGLAFLGLGTLLTKAKGYRELVQLASRGNRQNVDLLVKDTAGAEYNNVSPDAMVSSFGKPAKDAARGQEKQYKEEDLADSLLYSVTDNLAQNVYMVAKAEQVHYVCFCGSFMDDNKAIREIIKEKIQGASYYLGHQVTPLFIHHQAYLGAIGALMASHNPQNNHYS